MKKIALVIFKYPFGASLPLINSAQILAQAGYEVDVFIDAASYEQLQVTFDEQNVVIHPIEPACGETASISVGAQTHTEHVTTRAATRDRVADSPLRVIYRKLIYRGPLFRLFSVLQYRIRYGRDLAHPSTSTIEHYTACFFPELEGFATEIASHVDETYVCIIGVEPLGLIASTLVAHSVPAEKLIPTIYFNTELLLERECRSVQSLILKSLEKVCNQACYLTIVQDRPRARYLIQDNELRADRVICVPVAGLEKSHQHKSNVLRQKFNIGADKHILVYAGNIVEWALCLEMARAAQRWREDKVLVMHSWIADTDDNPYIRQIRALTSSEKVYLSFERLPSSELIELLSSADIGLAFYKNKGKNFYEIGYSSNKLVQYLRVGLPVITINFPSFKKVIDEWQCGAYTSDPAEIEACADALLAQYETFKRNAFRCYEREYTFDRYFAPLLSEIHKLSSTRAASAPETASQKRVSS